MTTFSSIIDDMDVEFCAIESEINMLDDIFLESSADMDSTVDVIVTKIRSVIENVKRKITELLNKVAVKEKLEKTEKMIEDDPSLKSKKVEVPDYSKLDKLNDETLKAISDGKNIEAKMEKYRKQRNRLLAVGATVTVALGTALVMITKNKNKRIENLTNKVNKAESTLRKCANQNNRLKQALRSTREDNKHLKDDLEIAKAKGIRKASVKGKQIGRDVNNAVGSATDNVNVVKEVMTAHTEIIKNAGQDTINSVKDVLAVCVNPKASPVKKAGALVKGGAKVAETVKSVSSGEAKALSFADKRSDIREEIKTLENGIEKAKNVFAHTDDANTKVKASQYISKAERKLKRLRVQVRSLK